MNTMFPRLAAVTIERESISSWLTRHADVPLRLLLAPAGSGKTTALVQYARTRAEHVLYVHTKQLGTERSLEDELCRLAGLQSFEPASFLASLCGRERVECIIDGVDQLSSYEEELLERLVYDIPAHVGLIFAGTKSNLAVHRLEVAGLARVLPQARFLFTAGDTQALCASLGLTARDQDVVAINECCSGWPAAVADILRYAVEEDAALPDAYSRWIERRGRSFATYVQEEIDRLPTEVKPLFAKALKGETISQDELTQLEQSGAFVLASEGGVRAYNVISDLLDRPATVYAAKNTRIMLRMFGRFSIRCGDREVSWIRRRDQQLFRFIALRPSGRVMKSELIEMFWPDADQHSAAQSLRTACSNIRKALASALDTAAMERLFVTEGQEICVNVAQVVADVRRFKSHIHAGNEAENDARPCDAFAHYHAANRLYRADLFSGEPEEAWFIPQREVYRDMAKLARERISTLRTEIETGDADGDGFLEMRI